MGLMDTQNITFIFIWDSKNCDIYNIQTLTSKVEWSQKSVVILFDTGVVSSPDRPRKEVESSELNIIAQLEDTISTH